MSATPFYVIRTLFDQAFNARFRSGLAPYWVTLMEQEVFRFSVERWKLDSASKLRDIRRLAKVAAQLYQENQKGNTLARDADTEEAYRLLLSQPAPKAHVVTVIDQSTRPW